LLLDGIDDAEKDDVECTNDDTDLVLDALLEAMEVVDGKCMFLLSLLYLNQTVILHISKANGSDEAGDSHNDTGDSHKDTRSVLLEQNVESKHMIGRSWHISCLHAR